MFINFSYSIISIIWQIVDEKNITQENRINTTWKNRWSVLFIKVIIKQKGDTIVKEEILECADGKGIETLVIGSYLLNFIMMYQYQRILRYYTRQTRI